MFALRNRRRRHWGGADAVLFLYSPSHVTENMGSLQSNRNMFKEIVQALMTFEGRESVTAVDD